ncbi:MAG: hypothetical protein IPK74_01900 [Deltaproteobacteria bacterium]|nr:hypothetical protein [Deltaproteobacteria bacterium]
MIGMQDLEVRGVPSWATFFDEEQFGDFMRIVEADLARRGDVVIEEGVAELEIDGGGQHRLGLQNLAQLCNQVDREGWRELVREHFDRVIVSTHTHDLDALGRDYAKVCHMLKVRLYARDSLGDLADSTVYREVGEDLVSVLVYDLPDAVATVPTEAPRTWPIALDQVYEVALRNVLEQDEVEIETLELDDGTRFQVMVGESFFVTSRLLVLEDYLDPVSSMGALVAVPNRHTMLFAPIVDLTVVDTLHAMAILAHRRHAEGPGSLSPSLYWWRDGTLLALPTEIDEDGVRFFPPTEFVEGCLERLAKPSAYGPN